MTCPDIEIDSSGYIIYHGEEAAPLLKHVMVGANHLLIAVNNGEFSREKVAEQVDELLFKKYFMSMLSDGFREFYIQKHKKYEKNHIDNAT